MKKTILICISALVLAFTSVVKADISISGYQEFFAGSVDQSIAQNTTNHGYSANGMSNGNFSRLNATYSTTLDSGIEVNGSYTANARDCSGNRDGICGVVNFNSVALSGSFGTIGVGEKFDVGAGMLSRMTASGPMSEPDANTMRQFYNRSTDHNFGTTNEFNYADNSVKITYNSNVYSGFSFAAGFTPNSAQEGGADDNQASTITLSKMQSFTDILSTYAKYQGDVDGIGYEFTYGMQTGNAGHIDGANYSDYEETAYSARLSFAGFAADYRKNEQGDSGQLKNGNAGNDEGTSICGEYLMGNIGLGACQVESNFTDTNNRDNSQKLRTYSAEYQLGGGMKIGVTYFDQEETANNVIITDVDGIISRLAIGF